MDKWRSTNSDIVKPSEALQSWVEAVSVENKKGRRVVAQCPPVSIAIVFFETGRVKDGLRHIGLKADIPDFDFDHLLYTPEHMQQLLKLVDDLKAAGL
jgi:hypothetical protein